MSLIARGFTAKSVMDAVIKKYPQHEKKIQAATAAGFGYDTVARYMDKNKGSPDEYLTEHEKAVKFNSDNRKKRAVGLVAGAAALAGGAGYLYANRNQGVVYPSEITGGPGSATATSGGPRGQPPQLPNQSQGLIPYNPQQGGRGVVPTQQGAGAQAPTNVMPSGPVIIPPYEHNPQKNVGLVRNIREDKRIAQALASGLSMPAVIDHLRKSLPKGKLALLDRAPGGFEQVLEDFDAARRSEHSEENRLEALQRFKQGQVAPEGGAAAATTGGKPPSLREQELKRFQQGYGNQQPQAAGGQPEMAQAVQQAQQAGQPQFQHNEALEAPAEALQQEAESQQLAKDISKPIVEEIKKQGVEERNKDKFDDVDFPSAIKNVAMTPKGIIEITHRGAEGVIGEVNGKQKSFKHSDVELPPSDFEEAVRTLVNAIPENEKSTAIQSAIRIPLPEGLPSITLMKFYDGKIAWYVDVPEEDYQTISLGNYSPKGMGKTGIAEYNPSVMDSRGAAFHNLIKINPKYNKENKGKMWGYADNHYDALAKIQPILKMMSKERIDEAGNVITPKPRKKKST